MFENSTNLNEQNFKIHKFVKNSKGFDLLKVKNVKFKKKAKK